MNLKLLSYNIRYGGIGREEDLAAVIREAAPDTVVFQEATRPHVIERLAAQTGMKVWGAQTGYSVGFMSRLEVAHYEWHCPPGTRRPFLEIVHPETGFRIFGLHLSAVHSNWTERRRVRELRATLNAIKRHQEGFHVLVGDFNTLAPGELLNVRSLPFRLRPLIWLSGALRWETIQIMLDAGYADGYRTLHKEDKGFTFPTWNPHVRLDYLFVPAPFADRLKVCQVVNGSPAVKQASDHFPLLADILIPTTENRAGQASSGA
ncbi:MAG TPA: endonuclease/exonuclease/phosphatase family protein [Blastocatellia bacterium]|nr:endonuclease/exonuclease/phosphatase family protein [Blastocatellia bacterium]